VNLAYFEQQERNKLVYFFFQLIILLSPVQLAYHFWPNWAFVFGIRVDYFAPTIFLTDILIILTLFFWQKKLSLILALLMAISFLGLGSTVSFFKWLKLLELTIFGYFVYRKWGTLKSKIEQPLLLAVFYTGLLAVTQFLIQRNLGGVFWLIGERQISLTGLGMPLFNLGGKSYLRPFASFAHPNQMAGFLLVSLILVFKKPFTPWKLICLFLGFLGLTLSFSQNAWGAGLIILLLALVLKQKNTSQFKNIFISLLFIGSLLQFVFASPLLDIKRLSLITAAGEMFAKNPIWGVGLGNFISYLPMAGQWWLQPVHNIYLLVLVETGLLGFLFCFWFLIKKIHFQEKRIFLSLLAILLTGFFDHYWLTLQQTQILFTIVLGANARRNS
jgi:O-antigen ligase